MQLQQEQPQLVPHLQVVQSQPPFSVAISNPPELALWVAATRTVVLVAVASTSGYIPHPLHPLPHLQPEPQPQFPPQHDILLPLALDRVSRLVASCALA
ncbi:hypothetical protein, partial [Escherichia coli]|uniref:hypothetical protein n=1 Tax=Escherichia coli TaxID=562 RepID=UPI001BFC8158